MQLKEVDLFSLPYDLQLPIVKKLTFKEFCRLSQCCFLAMDLCYSRNFKLHFDVDEIILSQERSEVKVGKETVQLKEALSSPAKITAPQVVIKDPLSEEQCTSLTRSLQEGKASSKKLVILDKPSCSPDTLAKLIKTLGVTHLETKVNLGAAFFEHDVFLELEDIALRCCSCSCLLHFQVKKATITTHPQRPVAQLIMRKHIEDEWKPQGGHPSSY